MSERMSRILEEAKYSSEERQVIMPSLVLGLFISLFGMLISLTGNPVPFVDWFAKENYEGITFIFILSLVGVIMFFVWLISANTIMSKTKPIPLSEYSPEQRRMVLPPIILGLTISIGFMGGYIFTMVDWWNFTWFFADGFNTPTYIFLASALGVILFLIWLLLLGYKKGFTQQSRD